jgi:protein gp37
MRMRPATAPRGQALVLRRWIVIASPARVNKSPGCKFCDAELFTERFRGHPFEQGFDLRLVPEKLDQPLHWRRPRKIFVNSMSDLFHEDVPADYIARVGDAMRRADWHVFQVLTKRGERLRELLRGEPRWMADLHHVAFGVRVADRRYGLPRISFASGHTGQDSVSLRRALAGRCGPIDLTGIDWVIVGGESGPRARPMLREWVVQIRRQCRARRVPFFFKQWGGTRKRETGRTLDGRTYDEFRLPSIVSLAFSYLRTIEDGNERMVDLTGASWNRLTSWLCSVQALLSASSFESAGRSGRSSPKRRVMF